MQMALIRANLRRYGIILFVTFAAFTLPASAFGASSGGAICAPGAQKCDDTVHVTDPPTRTIDLPGSPPLKVPFYVADLKPSSLSELGQALWGPCYGRSGPCAWQTNPPHRFEPIFTLRTLVPGAVSFYLGDAGHGPTEPEGTLLTIPQGMLCVDGPDWGQCYEQNEQFLLTYPDDLHRTPLVERVVHLEHIGGWISPSPSGPNVNMPAPANQTVTVAVPPPGVG
jgi:hypothetical protein